MRIQKCDRCKKNIENSFEGGCLSFQEYGGGLGAVDLCVDCAAKVSKFLQDYLKKYKKESN